MPKYNYLCPNCDHNYVEHRDESDPQFFTKCNRCGQSDYVEVE